MRPQVGKRARAYEAPKEVTKKKARLFVESRQKYNMATKEDYLVVKDVAVALNMNALEQRMLAKQKMIQLLNKNLSREKIIEQIEEELAVDLHRLKKYYAF